MGLGLGLGVAAMAQMRAGGGMEPGRGAPIGGVTSAPAELMGQSTMASLYSSVSVLCVFIDKEMFHFLMHTLLQSNGSSQPRAPSPAKPSNFAAGVIKELQIAPNRIDLEVGVGI